MGVTPGSCETVVTSWLVQDDIVRIVHLSARRKLYTPVNSEAYVCKDNLTPVFFSITQNVYFCLELKGFSSLICGYFLLTWLSSSTVQKFNFHSWTLSCPLWHWFTVGAAPYFVGVSLSVKPKVHNTSIPGYLTPKISFLAVGGRWLSTNPEASCSVHSGQRPCVRLLVSCCSLPPWKCQSQFWCWSTREFLDFLLLAHWNSSYIPLHAAGAPWSKYHLQTRGWDQR